MAGSYLQILQGDTYSFSTNIAVSGVDQNVYGADISFYALANQDDDTTQAIITANTNTGQITISGNNNNTVTVSLNSAYTNTITEANVAHWFLRAELANGAVYTLDRGRLCVRPGQPPTPF